MKTEDILINKLETTNLFEIYGVCLTKKQYEVLDLYLNCDYTISEISDALNVSRQAVFDNIKKAVCNLNNLEQKLLIAKNQDENSKIKHEILNRLDKLNIGDKKIKQLIEKLI